MPRILRFVRSAQREMLRLSDADQIAIGTSLDKMVQNPGAVDIVKLSGEKNKWRLRVGQWRVILQLDNYTGIIWVLRILPRKDAYRD